MLYALERKEGKPGGWIGWITKWIKYLHMILVPMAFLVKLHEISVEPYVPHAVFVPFIGLTSLRTDSGKNNLPQA
jgi:hypothetical protein